MSHQIGAIKPKDIDGQHPTDHEPSHSLFGFWVYIMTDLVIFACLFATYLVLRHNTAMGPSAGELFDMSIALQETIILLVSSFTCGMALIAAYRKQLWQTYGWMFITFALGVSFLAIELHEFSTILHEGYSWQSSAFLSAFFTLVGTHGLHIAIGLIWLLVLFIQLMTRGFKDTVMRRITMFGVFWHFLDVVWIFIFTLVYLMGEIGL